MTTIAHIYNDYTSKFGVPRQSGLVNELESRIIFEPQFRSKDALKGIEGFDYIWLLWKFDNETNEESVKLTVRPPRLGGNTRMGVFATRSPFRPNGIGLSSVRIANIEWDTDYGPQIIVEGADLMNGTRILDIKPYIPISDCHPEARGGFTEHTSQEQPLEVKITDDIRTAYPFTEKQWQILCHILSADPRPRYQNDPEKVYSFEFAGKTVHFMVDGKVVSVVK